MNFARDVPAFFTNTLPMCTSIHATIIIASCSIVKNRRLGSFIFSLRCFSLSNHTPAKYSASPVKSWISMLSIKKKLLWLSLVVNSFLADTPLKAPNTVHTPNSIMSHLSKLCITRITCITIFLQKYGIGDCVVVCEYCREVCEDFKL